MSDIDPYAPAVEAPRFNVTPDKKSEEQAPAEKPVDAPQTEEIAIPEGSIKEVLRWVGEDSTKAQAALDAENKGEKRSTLVTKLEAIIN